MDRLDAKHWTNYWQKGTVTTFHKKFENNYDGEIKLHWNEVFGELKEGSCVVDLGTGNGALLSLLDEFLVENTKSVKAYGIDFAELNVEIISKIKSLDIVLKEKTFIEDTGLLEDSIDLVVSQYGVEYSNLDKTVIELDRILKPKSKISFIMHNESSQIIKEGSQTLDQIDLVNSKLKLVTIIREMLPTIEKLKDTGKLKYKTKADRLRNKLNKAMQEVQDFARSVDDPGYIHFFYENALAVFKGVVANEYTLREKLKILSLVEKETRNLKLRMTDLTSVAMTDNKNEKFILQLNSIGFKKIKIESITYNRYNVGQILTAERDY